jgi:sortase A
VVVTAAPTTVATTAATEPPTTAAPTTTEEPAPLPTPAPPPADDRPAAAGDELGRIVIPRLGIDAPMHQGVDLTTLDLGPGHWPGSALPGQVGNVVIAGHRVSHTRPFRYIDRLQVGDTVVFQVGGRSFTYRMTSSEIVTPDRIDITDPTPTPTATLFACHPPGSTQYRYVVRLALVTG